MATPYSLARSTVDGFLEDRCPSMAAGVAFYTLFALPPLLYLLLHLLTWVLGLFYGLGNASDRAGDAIVSQAQHLLGSELARDEIARMIEISRTHGTSWWKTLLGIGGVLVGATGVVAALQESLNRVWGVAPDPTGSAVKQALVKRLASLAMILGVGFLLLVSFAVSAVLEAVVSRTMLGGWAAEVANHVVAFVGLTLFFAALYRYMPDARIDWRDTWVGAVATALLFAIGRLVLQSYLASGAPTARLTSAATSLAVILIWVYYSAMIVLLGAEFTRAWAEQRGDGIRPDRGAIRVRTGVVPRADGDEP